MAFYPDPLEKYHAFNVCSIVIKMYNCIKYCVMNVQMHFFVLSITTLLYIFTAPSLLGVSCSAATQVLISKREVTGYIFHHKFAIEMYNLRQNLIKGNYSEFKFMDDTYKPDKRYLDCLMKKWSRIEGNEKARTPYLSCALHNFLFSGKDNGYCLHQAELASYASSSNYPDFCIVPNDCDNDPAACVAISDYKREEHSAAVIESSAYSLRSKEHSKRFRNLRLVFPTTKETAELYIHYPIDKKVVSIRVFPAEEVSEAPPDETFFCMLYAGVHNLLNKAVVADGLLHITPSLKIRPSICSDNTVSRISWEEDGKVYKFFGHNTYSKANIAVVKILFPDAEEVSLTEDKHYSYIMYKRRQGSHKPNDRYMKRQFARLVEQLFQLHAKNYVHSDIRLTNLVFSKDDDKAWLIDFDLADFESTFYPSTFRYFDCRHPGATAGSQREKVHDVYSLSRTAEDVGLDYSIFKKYSDDHMSLDDIAKELFDC